MKPLIALSKMLSDLGQVSGRDSSPPSLILVLSRVAIDFNQHLAQYLVYSEYLKAVLLMIHWIFFLPFT